MARRRRNADSTYEEYADMVRGPGKYEGCDPHVPYFHGESADEESSDMEFGGDWIGIYTVSAEDRKIFPELKGVRKIALMEDNQGFVSEIDLDEARDRMNEIDAGYDEDDGW